MATVETDKGSWMVLSFCKQLKLLKEDVEVTEFLRTMANDIIMSNALGVVQTPQTSVFPHVRTLFSKWFEKLISTNRYE